MLNISSFLEKFKKLRDPKNDRMEVARILSGVLNFEISESEIEIKGNNLEVKNRRAKTEIFLNQEKILQALKENFPKSTISRVI